jgi:hypothetical protein
MGDLVYKIQSVEKKGNLVEALLQTGDTSSTIFFECDDTALTPSREALVALTLFPAMKAGAELQVGGEVSQRMLGNLPELQELVHTWIPENFQYISVTGAEPIVKNMPGATPGEKEIPGASRVGAFFSSWSGGMIFRWKNLPCLSKPAKTHNRWQMRWEKTWWW